MAVTFQLPPDLEQSLRHARCDLNAEAKEALLVALYRQRRITHRQLSQSLGLDRPATEDLLHKHHVTEDLGSVDDYLSDARILEHLRRSHHQ